MTSARSRRFTLTALAAGLSLAALALPGASLAAASSASSSIITVNDKGVHMPAVVDAGWHTFHVKQTSKDARDVIFAQLKAGYSLAQLRKDAAVADKQNAKSVAAEIKIFKHVRLAGGVQTAKAKASQPVVTVQLTPGANWVAVDLPSNAGKTVVTPFTVRSTKAGSLPKAAATISMYDFGFHTSKLTAGTHTVRFANPSAQTHMVAIASYDDGHSRSDVMNALMSDGTPSWIHNDGYYGLSNKGVTYFAPLTLTKKTHYFLICFMPDYSNPQTYHAMEGMLSFFDTK